jgi:hypothetical protein
MFRNTMYSLGLSLAIILLVVIDSFMIQNWYSYDDVSHMGFVIINAIGGVVFLTVMDPSNRTIKALILGAMFVIVTSVVPRFV